MLRLVLVTPYEIWEIYKCFRTERIEDIDSSFEHPKTIHGDITRTQNGADASATHGIQSCVTRTCIYLQVLTLLVRILQNADIKRALHKKTNTFGVRLALKYLECNVNYRKDTNKSPSVKRIASQTPRGICATPNT